jgi:hypothetical protein
MEIGVLGIYMVRPAKLCYGSQDEYVVNCKEHVLMF